MKISTLLAASALAVVASQASAATHNIVGTGVLSSASPYLASTSAFTGEGSSDGTTMDFTMFTTNTTAVGLATITTTGSFDIASGVGSSNVIGCTGAALVCGSVPIGPGSFDPALNYDANGGNPTYDLFANVVVPGLGTGTLTGSVAFVAAVPVPAAAWLFGSALIGLAGIGRNRK